MTRLRLDLITRKYTKIAKFIIWAKLQGEEEVCRISAVFVTKRGLKVRIPCLEMGTTLLYRVLVKI
jgi:hypothetical protein